MVIMAYCIRGLPSMNTPTIVDRPSLCRTMSTNLLSNRTMFAIAIAQLLFRLSFFATRNRRISYSTHSTVANIYPVDRDCDEIFSIVFTLYDFTTLFQLLANTYFIFVAILQDLQ
jgi:hypothetical protein